MASKSIDIIISTVLKKTGIDAARAALSNLAKHTKDFASAVGTNLTNIKSGFEMLVGAVRSIVSPIQNAIKSAFDFETAQTSFAGLLNSIDKSKAHIEDLRRFASRTPLTFDDLQQASKLLLSFGMDVKDVMPSLKMLGDISMGNAQKFQGLALVFAQVKAAGKLMGQDLLQMINQGFNPLTVIAQKTGKSVSELRDIMSKGGISFEMVAEAMRLATTEGGLFNNAMEDASKTGNGLFSTLQDNWADALRTFGNELMGVAKGGIQWCINKLKELKESGALKEWAEKARTAIYTVVGAFDALADKSTRTEAWDALKDVVVGGFELAANKAANVLMKAAPIIGGLIASGFTNLKDIIADALSDSAAKVAAEQQLGNKLYHDEQVLAPNSMGQMIYQTRRVRNADADAQVEALASQIQEETRRQKAQEAKIAADRLSSNYVNDLENEDNRFSRGIKKLSEFGKKVFDRVDKEAKDWQNKENAAGGVNTTQTANTSVFRNIVAPAVKDTIKSLKSALAEERKEEAKANTQVEKAKSEFERAFAMYRDPEKAAAQIAEERDYAADYKQLQKDASRYGGKWRIDELSALMAAGDTKGQAAKLEEWRKSSRFTPEVESLVRAAAADQTRTTAEDELRKISANTEGLAKKLDELLALK